MTQLHWTAGLHHDGSALYISNPTPALDEIVTLRLRAPVNAPIRNILIRSTPDGEGHFEPMIRGAENGVYTIWEGELVASMPRNGYRFHVVSSEGTFYVNGLGVSRAAGPDLFDFKLLADFDGPMWLESAVFYQIFPDRFHNGDPSNDPQPGEWTKREHKVQLRAWDQPPQTHAESGNLDFYGGDLQGIIEKLDYLHDLGVTALYLNPIFTSRSNHRYNMDNFFEVDPHLGGDAALVALREALDARGMRLMLDITPNHTGSTHPWFIAAQADPDSPTTAYYTFYKHPDDYASWLGVKSLPKLNYASDSLRDVIYRAPDSVLRYWLREPYRIDGWRLDVQNMTARQKGLQLSHKVHRGMRRAVKGDNPQAYLMGENFFDGTPHLQGDELDATMNYQGFNIPTWRWLSGYEIGSDWKPEFTDPTPMPSDAYMQQLDNFRAAVPWVIARQQFHQLCSHDTTRILNICKGDKALVRLGAAMLMTYPGVPCVYYGDEIGLAGAGDPDNRRTMPWDESEWDSSLRGWYRKLMQLRRDAPALRHGGFQTLYARGGLVVFQRHAAEQRLIVVAYRGPEPLNNVAVQVWHGGLADGVALRDLLGSGATFTVSGGMIQLTGLEKGTALVLEADET